MTNDSEGVAKIAAGCDGCIDARGDRCVRAGMFLQAYETRYDDSDFCGPQRRYYRKAGVFARVRAYLQEQGS